MGSAFTHGWVSLMSSGEVHLRHGVPDRVWMPADTDIDGARIASDIAEVTGLNVMVGPWMASAYPGEREALLYVREDDFGQVLRRLAHASAEVFMDRYHSAMPDEPSDFDMEAFARDFGIALELCGKRRGELAQENFQEQYRLALHDAADELAAGKPPTQH